MLKLDSNHPIRREAERERGHRRGLKALVAFFLPVCWAGVGVVSPTLWSDYGPWMLLLWGVLAVVNGVIWWNAYPDEAPILHLTVENSDLALERDELAARLQEAEKWVFHSYAASALRSMTAGYIRTGLNSVSEMNEALAELLSPLYLNGGDILGFEPGERWSFSVYLYSPNEDKLVPVWREKSRNHVSEGLGRSWGRGQGHVGKAFVDEKTIVTGDAAHPDVVQLCSAPASMEMPYDGKAYRSFASVPIGPVAGDVKPYGVLVGTSDRKDRFDQDSALLLMHYADSIGVLLALGKLDFDCMAADTQPYSDPRENRDEEVGQNRAESSRVEACN